MRFQLICPKEVQRNGTRWVLRGKRRGDVIEREMLPTIR